MEKEIVKYAPCKRCGYETGVSTPPPEGENKRCWKCGGRVYRDYGTKKDNMEKKPVLHLNLKKKYFDMILSGEKKEEYREIKPYWNRVFTCYIKIKGKLYHPSDVIIRFSNGYSKKRRQFDIECKNLVQRQGKVEWGAAPKTRYHVLVLGDILNQ